MKHRKGIELTASDIGYAETLGELAQWYELGACCPVCEHTQRIDRYELARRYGKGMRLATIGRKLICKRCGNRDGNRLTVGMLPRD
jgi:hypothetical protein